MVDKAYAIKKLKEHYTGDDLKKLEQYEEVSEIIHDKNTCDLCTLHKLREEILASDDVEILRAAVKTFSGLWLSAEFDRDYYKCIVDGSWPDADERITYIREQKGLDK